MSAHGGSAGVAGRLQAGYDPERDIYPSVKRLAWHNDFQAPRGPGGLRYFTDAIGQAYDERMRALNCEPYDPQRARWKARAEGWLKRGVWFPEFGPKRGEPGCEIPEEVWHEVEEERV